MGNTQDLAIGLSRTFLDLAGFHIFNSGTLCLDIGGGAIPQLNAGTLSVIVQSMGNLLDDRTASPGVKFKDAELLGVPWIVVVGRGWAEGKVELRNRFNGETRELIVGAGLATDITGAVTD